LYAIPSHRRAVLAGGFKDRGNVLRVVFSRSSIGLALLLAALVWALPAVAKDHGGGDGYGQSSRGDEGDQGGDEGDSGGGDEAAAYEAPVAEPEPPQQAADAGGGDDAGSTDGASQRGRGHASRRSKHYDDSGSDENAGQSDGESAGEAAAAPQPASPQPEAAPSPPPAESTPPQGQRLSKQSIGQPDFSIPTLGDAAPRRRAGGRAGRGPRAGTFGAHRARVPSGSPLGVLTTLAGGRVRAPRPAATAPPLAAASSTGARAATAAEHPSRPVVEPPPDPLPVRVVPEQVRRIVEVVPAELWAIVAALAALALGLATWSGLVALRARRLRRQREALLQEVGLLQTALLPPVPADVPVSVAYRPTDGPAAGGDFYDAFVLADGSTGIILGDVSGHGREALARTTLIRYTLRAYLEAGLQPREVVKVGGGALADHLDTGFATVAVAVHDPRSGRFTFACGGHHPPLVVGPAAHEPVTACSAPPIGVGAATGFRQSTFTLTAGSTACLYTDGLTEARADGLMLGRERLAELLEALPPTATGEDLLDRVVAAADLTPDDMAACIVRAPAGAPVAGVRIEELEVDQDEVGHSLEHFLRACAVPLAEVPGVLREAGEAARREGRATVRVSLNELRPTVDVVPANLVRLAERRAS
jgi:serine phosphatase RsbU (regulator of sigma subunit)